MTAPTPPSAVITDANADNLVDRYAPGRLKPYLKMARFDRPIGSWLLLFPCWWSQTLAELNAGTAFPDLWYLLLFLVGAFVMRGAGCTWNDIVDRDYDARVERTALRPIPSGQLSVTQAALFGTLLCLIGLLVLLQFNWFTVCLGLSSMALVAVYPFAKRFTYWPQIVLGLTFKWGALVGWAAIQASLGLPALVLYVGCILWTIGYDTIYAHQDKEDDAMVGLKSTALRFGEQTGPWLTAFYIGAVSLWAMAGLLAGAKSLFFVALLVVCGHLAWQISSLNIHDSANCLARFRSNRIVGWIMLAGIVGEMVLQARLQG